MFFAHYAFIFSIFFSWSGWWGTLGVKLEYNLDGTLVHSRGPWIHTHPHLGANYNAAILLGGRGKQGNMEETHADTKNM